MIRLSRLSDYAIVLVCKMSTSMDETFSARQLHEATYISQSAIMKIMKILAISGLVTSVRGASGGYNLASDPGDISILDIVKAIDGPVSVTLCNKKTTDKPCIFEAQCMAKTGWGIVNTSLKETLSSFSIADFITAHTVNHNKNKG